jgi:hypothetical protein
MEPRTPGVARALREIAGRESKAESEEAGDGSMPKAWIGKDERQYEHIKESVQERGMSTKRAKEIAARTVNKQRRTEGRTPNKSTQGTGNPRTALEDRNVEELRNIASDLEIEGRSKMRKQELVSAIRERR